jgi:hypothetical protein
MAAAIVATFGATQSQAGFPAPPMPGINMPLLPPGVNVQVNGYLPAPPGVRIYSSDDRPYYVRSDRRVYLERDRRHYKKNHGHRDRGYRDRGEGHGKRGHND